MMLWSTNILILYSNDKTCGSKQYSHEDELSLLVEGDKLMLRTVLNKFTSKSEEGQDLAEYSMMIGLIALLVIVSLTIIGGSINEVFTAIAAAIQNGV